MTEPGITARHPEVRCVRTRIYPGARAERPAISRRGVGHPTLHGNDLTIDIEPQRRHEPTRELAQRQTVPHRHWTGTHEALAARAQRQSFDGPADRIRAVQNPDFLARLRSLFEDVAQRRDKRIDPAPEVLQINEQDIERIHHRRRRTAHLTVEAEDGNAVHRIVVIRRLDHVVLLIAAQPMLRAERGAHSHVPERGQRVERVERGCVSARRDGPTGPRVGPPGACAAPAHREGDRFQTSWCQLEYKTVRVMEIRLTGRMLQRPI